MFAEGEDDHSSIIPDRHRHSCAQVSRLSIGRLWLRPV